MLITCVPLCQSPALRVEACRFVGFQDFRRKHSMPKSTVEVSLWFRLSLSLSLCVSASLSLSLSRCVSPLCNPMKHSEFILF